MWRAFVGSEGTSIIRCWKTEVRIRSAHMGLPQGSSRTSCAWINLNVCSRVSYKEPKRWTVGSASGGPKVLGAHAGILGNLLASAIANPAGRRGRLPFPSTTFRNPPNRESIRDRVRAPGGFRVGQHLFRCALRQKIAARWIAVNGTEGQS
jgi:hypothetical protein